MVQMSVRDEIAWQCHEVPWLRSEIKSNLELCDSPIGLNRSSRVPVDGQTTVTKPQSRRIIDRTNRFGDVSIDSIRARYTLDAIGISFYGIA